MRKRKYTDGELISAVNSSFSYRQVLKKIGLSQNSSYDNIKKIINSLNLDTSHFTGQSYLKGRTHNWNRKGFPLEQVMTKNSTYSRGLLKQRLLKDGILENECSECGQEANWNGKKLVMVLDHINGTNNDHRLENLRILCPNCNSQQETFCGKNVKKEKKMYFCKECNKKISKGSCRGLCVKCVSLKTRKVKQRPSREQLLKEIEETNYCVVGRKYGVSDNCIRQWIK